MTYEKALFVQISVVPTFQKPVIFYDVMTSIKFQCKYKSVNVQIQLFCENIENCTLTCEEMKPIIPTFSRWCDDIIPFNASTEQNVISSQNISDYNNILEYESNCWRQIRDW